MRLLVFAIIVVVFSCSEKKPEDEILSKALSRGFISGQISNHYLSTIIDEYAMINSKNESLCGTYALMIEMAIDQGRDSVFIDKLRSTFINEYLPK